MALSSPRRAVCRRIAAVTPEQKPGAAGRRKSPENIAGRGLKQPGDRGRGPLRAGSSPMERLDGTRSWRSASVCALFLASSCFLVAALVLILTKQPPPLQSPLVSAAHLVLKLNGNTSIHQGMLDWFDSEVQGAFLGSSFEYSSQELKIKDAGLYCIYAQITVEPRGHPKKEAEAVLSIHRKNEVNPALLTLHLHLSDSVKEFYTNSTSQIYRLSSNDVLYATLEGSTKSDYHWALKESGNFFGAFRINEFLQKRL